MRRLVLASLAGALTLAACTSAPEAPADAWAECERRWVGADRANCIAKVIQQEQAERNAAGAGEPASAESGDAATGS